MGSVDLLLAGNNNIERRLALLAFRIANDTLGCLSLA